jgi:hypothetical protein
MEETPAVLWGIVVFGLTSEIGAILIAIVLRLRGAPEEKLASNLPQEQEDRDRKRDAKRFNERLKLFAAFLNGIGIAFLITMAVAPIAQNGAAPISVLRTLMALVVAIMLHLVGQWVLSFWKSEE